MCLYESWKQTRRFVLNEQKDATQMRCSVPLVKLNPTHLFPSSIIDDDDDDDDDQKGN